jgi:acyl transferase domain-containing protein/NADPH:quinone reductase-like Zn-dependent oxidoreductase/acyl carrier protein
MSFRLPGPGSESFWSDLAAGRNLVTQVAPDRWTQDAYWHPRKSHAGTSYTFAAGSVGDVSGFDAEFFGISPREAAQMDPQQRLLLEASWEAMENAGIRPSDMRGAACGVYVGVSTIDYSFRFADDLSAIDSAVATGTSSSITANRISYAFDLRGPSLAVDTACSSSLVAFHLACRSIATGESTHALAGGVSLHMHPYGFVTFSKASMLSRRGVCNVFDAAGDGYVRSEGCGMFLLKDYERAVADGDRILAVVAASAVNADGRKSGLTVPSAAAQAQLLKQAYDAAGIAPAEIDYIEAHGTGTSVGDPIETRALGEALGQCRPKDRPLLIGSVKSNLGHLEAAAGVAGLVKALYCVEHRAVPATINLEQPNPNIRFDEWNLRVATALTPLKPEGRVVIGINSFGFGGANAHVVLESPERNGVRHDQETGERGPLPVMVSGRSAAALKAAARELAGYLRRDESATLYDVGYTAAFHRDWHDHRAVVLADTREGLADALAAYADGAATRLPLETGVALPAPAGLAFVYTGNGSQWEGMGRGLLEEEPAFATAVRAVDAIFRPLAGYSLEDELAGRNGAGRYEYTEIAQPALFALQVGMTEVLRARGLAPAAVAGHSVGEVAAGWACGALTLEQAVRVIYHRSRLQAGTKGKGRMTAVALGEAAARELIAQLGLGRALSVAGINSSGAVTIAGAAAALDTLEAALNQRRVWYRRLDLDYAFHSPAMDGIEAGIVESLAGLRPGEAGVPFYSTVTGTRLEGAALGPAYWWRNIREPVRFDAAIRGIQAAGGRVFVEVGPHALLRGYIASVLKDEAVQGCVVPTLMRDEDRSGRLWSTACQAAIAGAPVDWKTFYPRRGELIGLPSYPWQRERHWHAVSPESYQRLNRRKEHPLLGYRLHESEWAWENQIDAQLCATLADHVIGEAIVMPGTGYAEMALAAARLWHEGAHVEIEQLEIRAPLILGDAQSKVVRFHIDVSDGSFTIKSRDHLDGEAWTVHAAGRIPREPQDILARHAPLAVPARPADYTGADHDALTRAVGLDYGPAFRAVDRIWVENDSACATLRVPEAIEPELERIELHPALLDCTFQLIIQLLRDDYVARTGTVYVPAKIDGLHFRSGRGAPRYARATLHRCNPHSMTASFSLYGEDGSPIAWIREARFNSVRLRKNPSDRLRYLDYHGIPRPHPLAPGTAPRRLYEQLHRKLSEVAQSAVGRGTLKRYTTEVEPLLDGLCGRFAARALKALAADGHVLTQADLQACSESNPEAVPLLERLLAMLEEDKAVVAAGNDWHFLPDEDSPSAEAIWNSLVSDYPDYLPVFHGVGRVGMHLADLLRGRRQLEQVLPRECIPSRLAAQVLADVALPMERALRELISQTLRQLPSGRRLRILEMGAGRPSFASSLCRALDFNRCDYVYATAAATLAEECHRLQEGFPNVQVRQVGPEHLEQAPAANEQFHLALVTADFATEQEALFALGYARKQLASGAAVLVIEQHPSRWMDFVFGGRRSWWSEGQAGGHVSRHKPALYWRQQMQKLGFQPGIGLELSAEGGSGPYLILTHEADHAAPATRNERGPARTWLLLADKEGFSARFADQLTRTLEARGDRVVQATPGSQLAAVSPGHYQLNPGDSAQFQGLFAAIDAACGPVDGILHLHGLSGASVESTPLLVLERQVDRCASAAALLRACEAAGIKAACWLVTARAAAGWLRERERHARDFAPADGMDAALWGFGRAMMNEASTLSVRLVDIDDSAALDTTTYNLAREISSPDAEQEIMLTASGDRYVPRLRLEPPPVRSLEAGAGDSPTLRLGFQFPGQLRNLRWESHPRPRLAADELEIEVRATGLNFRDVMYALGLLSDEAVESGFAGPTLGLEFAGIVTDMGEQVSGLARGDRVVGFGPTSFANRVIARASSISPIPAGLSFEAAATIPSVFFTVHYAVNHLARLQEGEKILIHGAAGGVGIAAIQIAKLRGAEIFATAGSDEKRDFLRLMGADHVFDSRSLAFADEILAATEGRGVDVVLNSLAGEAINRNLRVLRPFGRFLELGKRDFQENTRIGLRPFRNNISYFGIDADQLMKERPDLTEQVFREVMALFAEGALHPLPYHRFEAEEVVDAFRYMQQSRHIGKIVVTYRNGIHPSHGMEQPARRLELPADATYLVTGGLSGFGLKSAEWLAARGARNLVLVSRGGPASPEARAGIAALEAAGVRVRAAACDVTDRKALAALLSEISVVLPPLRGVVHAAAVIEDGLIRNLTRDQIRRVFAPKILGAHNLHQLTRGKELDFFILFSSATTLFGNPGQANYVAANACLEALAASRRAAGLPALCVRWGAIDDAGYLARNAQIKEALTGRMGGSALQSSVALDALEELLIADRSGVGVLELDWKALSRFLPTAGSPKFSELALNADDAKADEDGGEDVKRLLARLAPDELNGVFIEMLKKEVGEILRIAPDKIDEYRSLYDMGFDSLMGVELSTAVEARFSVRLPVMALSESPTVAKLAARILSQLTGAEGEAEAAQQAEAADQARQIATQHADEEHAETITRTAEELQSGELATSRMIQ